uniref:Receptor-like PK ALE2 N-terminal domain-containing protein n=1 Tax=Quercus lobata TaxID=97700 RepID=A0A7N2MKZ1_QUELO
MYSLMDILAACDQICIEPLTATPIGSPCGCVFPMKVRLLLDVATLSVFPESTVVDINLVPLGEKFDNTTAVLTSDRFWHKKVPLNSTLFGNYGVLYISYPGIPSSPPYGSYIGNGPTGSVGDLPITANFINKNQRMNLKTIAIISFSAFVLVLVFIGAFSILLKWRKVANHVEKLQTNFLWSGSNDDSKFHLVKWAKVCKPMRVGGLGIRRLRSFNTALLGKWLWRVKFWKHVWCGDCSLKEAFPKLYGFSRANDSSMAEVMFWFGGQLHWSFLFHRSPQDWEEETFDWFMDIVYSSKV